MERDADFTRKLIKQVKKYECLYDTNSPEYRNIAIKKTIWEKISKELKMKESTCKTRWKSLRDTFKKGVRYNGMTFSRLRPLPKTQWKYTAEMSFLKGIKEGRKLYSSDEDDEEEVIDDDGNLWPALPSPEDTQMDDFIQEEEPESNFCLPSDSESPDRKTEENIKPTFTEVMEKCVGGDNDDGRPSDPLAVRNSTLLLFESLAQKIMAASLSESDVDAIEFKVTSVVYEEISNRRLTKQTKAK